MNEKPILFSGPMVRAILDGRKTMTRRVCVPRYDDRKPCEHYVPSHDAAGWVMQRHCEHGSEGRGCPHGVAGDRLWVRETYLYESFMHDRTEGEPDLPDGRYSHRLVYRASHPDYPLTAGSERWKPSIFMPRWASRITLEITSVRVERLQDISEADAIAEGIVKQPHGYGVAGLHMTLQTAREAFGCLWDSINRKDKHGNRLPYSWADNPYVWVSEFKQIKEGQ